MCGTAGTAPRFGQGWVSVCRSRFGEWTVPVSSEEQPPAVSCANLLPSPSDVLFWGESCSDGIIKGAEGAWGWWWWE